MIRQTKSLQFAPSVLANRLKPSAILKMEKRTHDKYLFRPIIVLENFIHIGASVMQFQLGTSGLLQQLMRLLVRIPKMLWEPAFRCRPPSNEGTLGRSSITRSVLRASHARMHLPPPHFLPQPHEKLQVFETRINLTLGIAKNILSEIKHYFFFFSGMPQVLIRYFNTQLSWKHQWLPATGSSIQ